MKKLTVKFILFCILLSSTYFFAMWQLSRGQVDYFYNKFTYQASSLIIGVSRANDGISPLLVENILGEQIDLPILNFCFANQISDYGPIYLNAIQKKVKPGTKNGLFILEVEPGALSIHKTLPDSVSSIKKENSFLSTMNHFNRSPNFEYIRKKYTKPFYNIFNKSRRIDKMRYAHPDGWCEVRKKSEQSEVSKDDVLKWKKKKLEEFEYMTNYYKKSKARAECLIETINYLKDFGQVYLVRLPVSHEFLKIEQSIWPNFNKQIEEIAENHDVVYFDYSADAEQYEFYDGSHLFGHSAKDFTQKLCDDIKALN